jgi:hypothetical protein
MAVVGERIGAGALDAFAVVLLQAREVAVGMEIICWQESRRQRNRFEPCRRSCRPCPSPRDVVEAAAAVKMPINLGMRPS